jgi:RIO kinase 1
MSESASDDAEDLAYEYDFTSLAGTKYSELDQRYSTKINESMLKQELSQNLISVIKQIEKKTDENRIRVKDKSDRATVELVLDRRTRIVLYKLINSEKISEIFGCVSAGKEANVYYAINKTDQEFAIKIYKTSILVFKDRHRYVEGEFRFRRGYSKHNPRQMVAMWAEKEMRNLKRLVIAGIPCPEPLYVKQNVLLMSFIGKQAKAAPRLKDVIFGNRIDEFYRKTCDLLRDLYQKCKLVHADFSEYNLLMFEETVFVIDVSQAVEHDHPQALYFLRRDCANTNEFFRKHGARCLTVQGVFNYITDINQQDNEIRWKMAVDTEEINDEVFREIYIPRTLQEIHEKEKNEKIFAGLTGITGIREGEDDSGSESCEEGSQENDVSDDELKTEKKATGGDVLYSGLSKQERKAKVKEEKREKRKTKIPKHVKKHKIKKHKQS